VGPNGIEPRKGALCGKKEVTYWMGSVGFENSQRQKFEMLEDRLRNYYTILLFQPLVEAWDRYLLEHEGNVKRETLVAGPNDQGSLL